MSDLAESELLYVLRKVYTDMLRRDFESETARRKYVLKYVEAEIDEHDDGDESSVNQ